MKTLVLIFLFTILSMAAPKPNCKITILFKDKEGKSQTHIFDAVTKNKAKCAARANLHKTNFEPGFVTEKTVSFKWDAK